jgi:predicted SnoaL-like aldol condensation-catalyzing enzyme
MQITKKDAAISFLSAYSTKNPQALEFIHPRHYQCNKHFQYPGLLGFAEKMLRQQQFATEIRPIKVIQDGDFVSALSFISGIFSGMGIDIFRFKGSKIIEHWENHETAPAIDLGHSISGIAKSEIQDRNKTESNKKLAVDFVSDVLIGNNPKLLKKYSHPTHFKFYNLHQKLKEAGTDSMRIIAQNIKKQSYHNILNVIGEGNHVNVYSDGIKQGKPYRFCDLFVFIDNKIVEHRQIASFSGANQP